MLGITSAAQRHNEDYSLSSFHQSYRCHDTSSQPTMKGKNDLPILPLGSTHHPSRSRRPRFRTLVITCLVIYLFYTNAPARLRSWRHPIPTPDEKWMLEVADLMTELYTLLEKMQYLKPSSIAYAPHFSSAATNITLTTTILKLSPIAIKFLQILPYVQKTPGPMYGFRDELVMSATNWRAWRYNNELLLSTAFADMRDPDVLIRSRDPWYSDMISKEEIDIMLEEGGGVLTDPMMKILKPWQVAITGVDRIYTRQTNDTILMGGTMILDLKTSE
ncbi:hypothetical protein BDZ45DRAFT_46545 [Acephala macrosclerotiorum]|nr:hypothetical protein BDZ45DRAFT_46545 [Acephala macrosclerotiorum]